MVEKPMATSLAECDAIKREAVANRHAIVVGMSFIGCEVAASLTQLGVRVTATFPQSVPLERVLGKEVGAVIGAFHRANGVELLPESRITAFEGTERVEAAVTANGDRVPCDFAVVGIGIEPDVPTFASTVAQENGVYIPRFCWHERMKPVGMCRMCLVEVEGMRGMQISCATPVADGMVVNTQLTSPVAEKAQRLEEVGARATIGDETDLVGGAHRRTPDLLADIGDQLECLLR